MPKYTSRVFTKAALIIDRLAYVSPIIVDVLDTLHMIGPAEEVA